MRGRVAAAILLLLSLSSPAIPQCAISARASFPFRSTAYDLAIDGGDLWVASGYGVELLDRAADPPLPRLSIPLPGTTRVVRLGGGVVFAASDDRLYVVRREANGLRVAGSLSAGGTINDIAIGSHLYLATSAGLEQYDLTNPSVPSRTAATFTLTGTNVQSLAISGTSLFVADGDSTVEVFSIAAPSAPVKTATLQSLPRSIAVHVARERIYVSDGQNTDVFFGSPGSGYTRGAQFAFGSTAFATISGDEHFIAGTDRAVRAVDFGVASRPVERFEAQLPPHGGTNNRVFAMQRSGDRLYVAAGDIGVASFDTSAFVKPYALASYRSLSASSVVTAEKSAFLATPGSPVTEVTINPSGLALDLAPPRTRTADAVHDARWPVLLASQGATLWIEPFGGGFLDPTGPWSATLPAPVRAAVLGPPSAVALLTDGSVHTIDASGAAAPVTLSGLEPSLIAASADRRKVVFVGIKEDGNTDLRIYGGHPLAQVASATIPGAATGSIAAGQAHAAVFTYRGISLVDLATGAVTLLPDSDRHIATALDFDGDALLVATDRSLVVWDVPKARIAREFGVPSEPVALDAAFGVAVLATRDGVSAVRHASAGLPVASEIRNANRYYSRIAAADDRLYLAGGDTVDIYSTAIGFTPHYAGSAHSPGLAALAASDSTLFTLSSTGVVRAWSRAGALLRERTLHDGSSDWQPVGISTAGESAWVSYSRGCLTTGCERSTLVLDSSLATMRTLAGALVDLSVSGSLTAALFTSSPELRTYDTATGVERASAGVDSGPKSVATMPGEIYLLGSRLTAWDATTLARKPDPADPQPVSSWHDRIRIAGPCGLLTGKRAAVDVSGVPGWSSAPASIAMPSGVRAIALDGSRVFVLTEHSVEVLDSVAAPTAPKRRSAR